MTKIVLVTRHRMSEEKSQHSRIFVFILEAWKHFLALNKRSSWRRIQNQNHMNWTHFHHQDHTNISASPHVCIDRFSGELILFELLSLASPSLSLFAKSTSSCPRYRRCKKNLGWKIRFQSQWKLGKSVSRNHLDFDMFVIWSDSNSFFFQIWLLVFISSVRSSSGYHGLIEIRSAAAATHFSKFFKFFRF